MPDNKSSCLIIFAKNIVFGKVKTRLAKDIGPERALDIYKQLVDHTHSITSSIDIKKCLYYSDKMEDNDIWSLGEFEKYVQRGEELGERMSGAFEEQFGQGFSKICIIGTDCFDINETIINNAFEALDHDDFVIGPADDGGYYLLGMTSHSPELFTNKVYSTSHVFDDAISEIEGLNKSVYILPQLTDIDHLSDLNKMRD